MKFVDEVSIKVSSGSGGAGCLSFRREKYIPRGGPDGGDGGDGANIYLQADEALNTLVDFRYKRSFQGRNGEKGKGKKSTGADAEDIVLKVPVGTIVIDEQTDEVIVDLHKGEQQVLVAKGGRGGKGNTHFKSSTNRAPRRTTPGTQGETRLLRLELSILADVGLLGYPNAGKSSLIRSVSSAKPKVADYPFTTLIPNLGVVKLGEGRSFVMADIPGLVQGAAEGVGLGIRFLKHLARTKLLLHVVDLAPLNQDKNDIVKSIKDLVEELKKFSPTLAENERWIVFNKADVLAPELSESLIKQICKQLNWDGPTFIISAITGHGTKDLCYKVANFLEKLKIQADDALNQHEHDQQLNLKIANEGRMLIDDAIDAY